MGPGESLDLHGCHGDVYALADDVEREEAVRVVGKPSELVAAAKIEALPLWRRWHDSIVSTLESAANNGVDAARMLRDLGRELAEDEDIAASLYEARLQADMAGQLFVRAIEVPESLTQPVQLDARDARPSFLRLSFREALETFLARRLVTPEEFLALSEAARNGAFSATRLASEQVVERARNALLRHLEEGGTLASFIAAVGEGDVTLGIGGAPPDRNPETWYLETVYRTNVQHSYGSGRLRQMEHPAVVQARPHVQYRTARDTRVRPRHAALDRVVLDRSTDPGWRRFAPPLGFNCFPAGTLVGGAINAGLRAWYEGDLVELRTHGGRLLRVTPNHPLATPSGFVRAGDLREGEHVLGYMGHADRLAPSGVNPEEKPARIEDVFDALAVRGGPVGLRPRPHDLHGDAALTHGDVDVVGAYRELLLDGESDGSEPAGDLILTPADALGIPEHADGSGALGGDRVSLAPPGIPGGRALTDAVRSVHAGPLEPLCLGPSADVDAPLSEPAGHSRSADAKVIGQLVDADPGLVTPDQIVNVERVPFTGHVYDLQSLNGWIVADGIVASNCRCSLVTLRPDRVQPSQVRHSSDLGDLGPDRGWAGPGQTDS